MVKHQFPRSLDLSHEIGLGVKCTFIYLMNGHADLCLIFFFIAINIMFDLMNEIVLI